MSAVSFGESFRQLVEVTLGNGEGGVAEDPAHAVQVHAGRQRPGGEGMPKAVRVAMRHFGGRADVAADDEQAGRGEAFAIAQAGKQRGVVG